VGWQLEMIEKMREWLAYNKTPAPDLLGKLLQLAESLAVYYIDSQQEREYAGLLVRLKETQLIHQAWKDSLASR
jgi:hypothetical protein